MKLVTQSSIDALAHQLSGYLLQPNDSRFPVASQIDNGRVRLLPAAIVFPTSVNDIVLALKFAQANNLAFTVKGGGHSAAGYCLNQEGIVVDMLHFNAISFDRETPSVTVQAGARWRDVYEYMEATKTGLIPVGGACPSVGITGFILGGGFSFVSRSYGMGIDNLISLTIVTPDGNLRQVGEFSKSDDDKDLFWACRGGGGGNFGIVVDMEILVHKPRAETMLVGKIWFPMQRVEEIIGFYNDWVETLPNEMAIYGYCGGRPDLLHPTEQIKTIGLTPVFNGKFSDGVDILQDMLRLKPLSAELYDMTLSEWEAYNGSVTGVQGRSAYIRSVVLQPRAMTAAVAKIFLEYMSMAPSTDSFAVWTHAGGEISKKSTEETAFPHRECRFVPEVKAIWNADMPDDERKNVDWAYEFFEALAPHASGAYVNYIDPLLHNWAETYYGGNYERLKSIKQRVDPNNVFCFQQSIGSTFKATNGGLYGKTKGYVY